MHYFHWIFYFQIHRNSVLFGICMQPHSFTQLSLRKSCVALFILFFFICYMFICTNTFYIRDKIFSTWGSLPTALIVLVFQVPKSHEDHEVLPFLGGHLLLEQQQWTCRAVCKLKPHAAIIEYRTSKLTPQVHSSWRRGCVCKVVGWRKLLLWLWPCRTMHPQEVLLLEHSKVKLCFW